MRKLAHLYHPIVWHRCRSTAQWSRTVLNGSFYSVGQKRVQKWTFWYMEHLH